MPLPYTEGTKALVVGDRKEDGAVIEVTGVIVVTFPLYLVPLKVVVYRLLVIEAQGYR